MARADATLLYYAAMLGICPAWPPWHILPPCRT